MWIKSCTFNTFDVSLCACVSVLFLLFFPYHYLFDFHNCSSIFFFLYLDKFSHYYHRMESEWNVYKLVAYWIWEIGRENHLCVCCCSMYRRSNVVRVCMCLCVYGKFTAAYRLAIYKIFTRKMLLNNSCMNCRRGWTELKRIWKRTAAAAALPQRMKEEVRSRTGDREREREYDVFKVHVLEHVRLHYARVLFMLCYYIFFIWTAYKRWKDVQIIEYPKNRRKRSIEVDGFLFLGASVLFSFCYCCACACALSAQVEDGSAWITG